jgi:hypothetical protein
VKFRHACYRLPQAFGERGVFVGLHGDGSSPSRSRPARRVAREAPPRSELGHAPLVVGEPGVPSCHEPLLAAFTAPRPSRHPLSRNLADAGDAYATRSVGPSGSRRDAVGLTRTAPGRCFCWSGPVSPAVAGVGFRTNVGIADGFTDPPPTLFPPPVTALGARCHDTRTTRRLAGAGSSWRRDEAADPFGLLARRLRVRASAQPETLQTAEGPARLDH